MSEENRQTIELILADKILECDSLKKQLAEFEKEKGQISRIRLENQENQLKLHLAVSEKEKLMEIVRNQLAEIDNLRCKAVNEESNTMKHKDLQAENEDLKKKIIRLESQIQESMDNKEKSQKDEQLDVCTIDPSQEKSDIADVLSKQVAEALAKVAFYQKQVEMLTEQKHEVSDQLDLSKFQNKKLEGRLADVEKKLLELMCEKEMAKSTNTPGNAGTEDTTNKKMSLSEDEFAKKIIILDPKKEST